MLGEEVVSSDEENKELNHSSLRNKWLGETMLLFSLWVYI